MVLQQIAFPDGEHLTEVGFLRYGKLAGQLLLNGMKLDIRQLLFSQPVKFFINDLKRSLIKRRISSEVYADDP